MSTRSHPVRIDTRLLLQIYAGVAFSAGVTAVLFGPWLVGPDPAGVPWVRAGAIRQLGALMVVAGCFSLPLANVDDPESRRRGLLWFATGHAVLAGLVWLQDPPVQSAGRATWISLDGSILAAVSMLMWVAWLHGEDANGRLGGMVTVSLFGDSDTSPTRQLRSGRAGVPEDAPLVGGRTMTVIRVVIVDDHRVVTRSLQSYLESFADLRVVGTAASGEELLAHVDSWQPEVVVQDLLLPGGIDGIETTRRVLAKRPSVRVVALTASTDEARMMAVLRAGAAGYIRKDAEPETLLAAIRAVARGRTYVDPYLAGRVAEGGASADDLTDREREVLRRLALGESNKAIADVLCVSEETVKTHVGHILSKLGVENRAQAVGQALKRGLVSLEELA